MFIAFQAKSARKMNQIRDNFSDYLSRAGELTTDDVSNMQAIAEEQRFATEEKLVEQGKKCDAIFFVETGILRYYLITANGGEVNKSIRIAPCMVSSTVALVTGQPSQLSISCFSEVSALKISWSAFQQLMEKSHSLEHFYRRGVEALFVEREQRELSLLMDTAQQRYLHFVERYAAVLDQIPLYQVASYVGITAVALSRIRKRLGAQ